jgi:hypothetical protein
MSSLKLEISIMLDHAIFQSVAEQLLTNPQIVVDGRTSPVTRIGSLRLRTARFLAQGREYQAIEQNADKPSHWGKLARAGHKVVQFRDLGSQKYVAVSVDGQIREYLNDR